MNRKICVVVTVRASYSRIKTLLLAIKTHPNLTLQLVVTGSILLEKYGCLLNQIKQDGFDNIIKVSNLLENENATAAAKTTGLGIIELASIFENIQPDIVVTIADRYETISAAVAASFMNIPLAHVQGGEVTGNIDEKVRHAVSKLADYHFVATDTARQRLIRMGELPDHVWHTGCPSIDLAFQIKNNRPMQFDYENCQSVLGKPGKTGRYLVVMHHPVTTENNAIRHQTDTLLQVIDALRLPTFWFTPNPDYGSSGVSERIKAFKMTNKNLMIYFLRNLNPELFLKLVKGCACLIGNSSTGIREGSFLGTPVVNIGNRQRGRERAANVLDVVHEPEAIMNAIQKQLDYGPYSGVCLYGTGNAGNKIADILANVELSIDKQITY
ncbi:UDP-N-acetylglucosamine 2-epimerase [Dyadobacter sp. CY326]|uniref:UDP-N-acetylglucosamine 2-epimerase n=1 Tax=Dyadobacter sp. CY326 TaxID=2907300 RepID=UPI001F268C23|nr:UDP-N-acetylglucosamine 2-epimerase [Dyadobacter sp. CY326]MCE7068076.1 UDP-N-acetylglucosamine 2-epimerase [Dyadobacter sp. CY326]